MFLCGTVIIHLEKENKLRQYYNPLNYLPDVINNIVLIQWSTSGEFSLMQYIRML